MAKGVSTTANQLQVHTLKNIYSILVSGDFRYHSRLSVVKHVAKLTCQCKIYHEYRKQRKIITRISPGIKRILNNRMALEMLH